MILLPQTGVCRCAEEVAEQLRRFEHEDSGEAVFTSAANLSASEAAANEANANNDAVWIREEGADEFMAPGTSSHGVSSIGCSESAGSECSFGPAETPHEAGLRGAVIAQLRVNAQHWSVSQVQHDNLTFCHLLPALRCITEATRGADARLGHVAPTLMPT